MVVFTYHRYKRNYWLAKLTENYNLIAVSGSHGNIITSYYCCQFYLVNTTTQINAMFHHTRETVLMLLIQLIVLIFTLELTQMDILSFPQLNSNICREEYNSKHACLCSEGNGGWSHSYSWSTCATGNILSDKRRIFSMNSCSLPLLYFNS